MADKLSESVWTAFAKKRDLDDGALVKALKAFDKTDESKPEPRLDALEEVVAQLKKLVVALPKKKPPLPDKEAKEVKDKLYALLDVAEGLQKDTQAAKAAAESEDEEPDTPVLLTKKMVPLLRELKKGEARMNAMICTAGKATALLIMRRSISPARRKLLAEYIDAKGGTKYIVGEVLYENKALTFVVQSQAGGLAKRLRQALLDQVEMRFKVKVRGEDGEESDGEEGEDGEGAPGSDGAQATGTPPAPPKPASAEQLAYTQRMLKVTPRYDEAREAKHPELTKLTALMGMASERANGEPPDYAGAIKALMGVEALLAKPVAQGEAGEGRGVDPGAALSARVAALLPKIKEALAAAGPNAATIKLKMSEVGALGKQGRHEMAQAVLDEVEALLEGRTGDAVGEKTSPPSQSEDPQRQAFDEIVSSLKDDFDVLDRTALPPALAEQFGPIKTAWNLAQEAAAAGNLQRALLLVNRLAEGGALARLLQAVQGAGGGQGSGGGAQFGREGIRAYRSALVEMRSAVGSVQGRIGELMRAIPAAMAEEADFARSLGDALGEYSTNLFEVVDEAIGVAEDPDEPVTRELAGMLRSMLDELSASPLVRHVDENPFGVKVDAQRSLQTALKKVLDALPEGAK